MSIIGELKRRDIFRVAARYVIAAWLINEVADVLKDLAKSREPYWRPNVWVNSNDAPEGDFYSGGRVLKAEMLKKLMDTAGPNS